MSEAVIIAEIPKNQRETLRISLDLWRDNRLANLRLCVPLAAHCDQLVATKSGFSINVSHLSALRQALSDAEDKAKEMGWL